MGSSPIDAGGKSGLIASMLTRAIKAAMRSSIEELIAPQFQEIREQFQGLRLEFQGLRQEFQGLREEFHEFRKETQAGFERVNQRIDHLADRLDAKIDEQGKRLDGRIDHLAAQQGRMIEQISSLKGGFDVANTLAHRIDRLEDRVFAKAG